MVYFFAGCSCPADLKKRYRELAKKYHPDCLGGDVATFQALSAEYEARLSGTALPKLPEVWGRVKRKNRIIRLVAIQQDKQLKKAWVYHAFRNTLAETGQQLTRADLEFMAKQLGYKPAWVNFKCQENSID